MEIFQTVMYVFYGLLFVAIVGVGIWFYKKKKELD
jgi:LPXTG-motif cell wall-anchored protein